MSLFSGGASANQNFKQVFFLYKRFSGVHALKNPVKNYYLLLTSL